MSKVKAAAKRSPGQLQHQFEIDDSPLPSPQELEHYQRIDPTLMEWLKSRADKEQDARLKIYQVDADLRLGAQKKRYRVDILTLMLAFFIIISGMVSSAFLLTKGFNLAGTLFAGVSVLAAVKAFLNFKQPTSAQKKENPTNSQHNQASQ